MINDLIVQGSQDISEVKLEKIIQRLPETNRAIAQFCKQNSQTTTSLMSLNMVDMGPFRVLRQIAAQLDTKINVLKELSYQVARKRIRIEVLQVEKTKLSKLRIQKLTDDINSIIPRLNSHIREIGALQDRYDEIREYHDIPVNWTEEDFEKSEIEHHIKCIFRNAIRDRLARSCNMGTMEYMEQFGITPMQAYYEVDVFLSELGKNIENIDIREHYDFYERMYKRYKQAPYIAAKRLGLKSILYMDWLLKKEA